MNKYLRLVLLVPMGFAMYIHWKAALIVFLCCFIDNTLRDMDQRDKRSQLDTPVLWVVHMFLFSVLLATAALIAIGLESVQ